MLYNAATSREMIHGTAYFLIRAPIGSVSKNVFDFSFIGILLHQKNKSVSSKELDLCLFGDTLFQTCNGLNHQ